MFRRFNQVDLRLARARKHMTELERVAKTTITRKSVTFYSEEWDDLSEYYVAGNRLEILDEVEIGELSVIIDDIVHNLRAALNYLVVTLARVDSAKHKVPRSLQFPIVRDE